MQTIYIFFKLVSLLMQIDLSNNGLLKAWMDGKVKNYCEMMFVIPQQYIPHDVLTEFVQCLFLIMVFYGCSVSSMNFALALLPSVIVTEQIGPMS